MHYKFGLAFLHSSSVDPLKSSHAGSLHNELSKFN